MGVACPPRYRFHVFANTFAADIDRVVLHHVPALRTNTLATVGSFAEAAEIVLRTTRLDLIHAQGFSSWSADIATAHVCNAARRAREPARRWKDAVFRSIASPLERRFYRQPRLRHVIAVSRVGSGLISEGAVAAPRHIHPCAPASVGHRRGYPVL